MVAVVVVLVMLVPATSAACSKVLIDGVRYTIKDTP